MWSWVTSGGTGKKVEGSSPKFDHIESQGASVIAESDDASGSIIQSDCSEIGSIVVALATSDCGGRFDPLTVAVDASSGHGHSPFLSDTLASLRGSSETSASCSGSDVEPRGTPLFGAAEERRCITAEWNFFHLGPRRSTCCGVLSLTE